MFIAPPVQRRGILVVRLGGFGKRLRDFEFGLSQDDARLFLARRLRLSRHGVPKGAR
jgi:hypothetical protein